MLFFNFTNIDLNLYGNVFDAREPHNYVSPLSPINDLN